MSNVAVYQTERPRNVNAWQAASILYGDWGTSKIYLIGLAFALAAYSSFWLILAISLLNILVGLNYIIICKYFPSGGGVYASVRHRSQILALLGAFFLICDYTITIAIGVVSAFSYLGVESPEYWAMGMIALIGGLNFFGPRHTGNLALLVTSFAVVMVLILGALILPQIDVAWEKAEAFTGSWHIAWIDFVGMIVALSGVESIANMTGVMQLDKGSSSEKPSVLRTSTPAIISVMLEVSIFTALFSLGANLLPGLIVSGDEVSAPGYPNVRDALLRYMGESLCGNYFSGSFCHAFGLVLTLIFGIVLISAVNTALIACSSLLFIMAKDGQMPDIFSRINRFGVPNMSLLVSMAAPIFVLVFVHNMLALANLYAIGFVGAIATNLGSTSTDRSLSLKMPERTFMFITFIIMAMIEITLFIEKPHARVFIITVIAIGLLLRGLVLESRGTKAVDLTFHPETTAIMSKEVMASLKKPKVEKPVKEDQELEHTHPGPILCAVTHAGKTLEFALQRSKTMNQKLYILFVREQKVAGHKDRDIYWLDDLQACETFDYALTYFKDPDFTYLYAVSDLPAVNIVEYAKLLNVSTLILGMSRKGKFMQLIRGDVVTQVFKHLPQDVDFIIIS